MAALADIAARYTAERMAGALNTTPEIAAAALDEDAAKPADWTPEDVAECDDRRAKAATALRDAAAEAGSKIAVRYVWTAVRDAPVLVRIVVDLAVCELYDDVVPDDMETRRKDALKELDALCRGKRALLDAAGDVLAPAPRILFDEPAPAFPDRAFESYLHPLGRTGNAGRL